jgi:alkylhydroperoxidase family enzyme
VIDKRRKIAWIETVTEDEAEGDLAEAYATSAEPDTGDVDHIMKIHSLNPQSLFDHYHLYKTLMYGKSPLKRTQREMIAVVVSAINKCKY